MAKHEQLLDTIGVDPGFAHRGVGHALVSQLLVNLSALGIERVETVVAPRPERAQRAARRFAAYRQAAGQARALADALDPAL